MILKSFYTEKSHRKPRLFYHSTSSLHSLLHRTTPFYTELLHSTPNYSVLYYATPNYSVLYSSTPRPIKTRNTQNFVQQKMKLTPFYTNIWVFETTENFSEELAICTSIEKKTVSERKSNMLGYQSTNYSGDNLHTMFPNIVNKLHNYISTVATDVNANLVVDNFWFNINRKHHYNLSHMHPFASFSSVLYLKAHDLAGDLVFENPTTSYAFPLNDKNETSFGTWRERVQQNKLIVFPAYVRHYVEPNMTDEMRVSLTINFRDQKYNSMRPT